MSLDGKGSGGGLFEDGVEDVNVDDGAAVVVVRVLVLDQPDELGMSQEKGTSVMRSLMLKRVTRMLAMRKTPMKTTKKIKTTLLSG